MLVLQSCHRVCVSARPSGFLSAKSLWSETSLPQGSFEVCATIPPLRSPAPDQRPAPARAPRLPVLVRSGPRWRRRSMEQGRGAEKHGFSAPAPTSLPGHFLTKRPSPLPASCGSPPPPAHTTAAQGDSSHPPRLRDVPALMQEGSLRTLWCVLTDRKFQKELDHESRKGKSAKSVSL